MKVLRMRETPMALARHSSQAITAPAAKRILLVGEDDLFTTDVVSPQWVWWLALAVLGMTAGLVYDVARGFPAG